MLDRLHRFLSENKFIAWICVKLRNQTNCIIGLHLGETANPNHNGEYTLLDLAAPRCKCFVDVGANVGNWTTKFLSKSLSQGFLFEPSSEAYTHLTKKFSNTDLTLKNIAIGKDCGTSLFIEEKGCGETSSLAETHTDSDISPKEVRISTLDREFFETETNIDYLKVDTEGYDFNVLLGAKKMLEAGRIRFIQFEYNGSWIAAGSSLFQAIRYLKTFGFDIYLIKSTGLHDFNYDLWGDYFRYSNYFACHPSDKFLYEKIIGDKI